MGDALRPGAPSGRCFGDAISGEHLNATVACLEARIAAEAATPTPPPDTTAAPADTTDSSGFVDAAGELQTGAEVYVGRCAGCHGANGEGGVGPALANTELSADEVALRISGGGEAGMPAFEGVLDPDEVQNVTRYVLDLEGDETDSGGGGKLFAAVLLVLVVGGAFFLWRSDWMSRSSRARRARES